MTIEIELNPEIEARLAAEARAQGIPLERAAELLLQKALASRLPVSGGNLSIEEFHEMLRLLAEGSEKLPSLPTESFTRESFYQDRH
ncbi:MAG TPA: hypothetical protein VFB04_06480 [Terriglobales bacterium]|nr:hypothetical protein [Terriglobales bacterium]